MNTYMLDIYCILLVNFLTPGHLKSSHHVTSNKPTTYMRWVISNLQNVVRGIAIAAIDPIPGGLLECLFCAGGVLFITHFCSKFFTPTLFLELDFSTLTPEQSCKFGILGFRSP